MLCLVNDSLVNRARRFFFCFGVRASDNRTFNGLRLFDHIIDRTDGFDGFLQFLDFFFGFGRLNVDGVGHVSVDRWSIRVTEASGERAFYFELKSVQLDLASGGFDLVDMRQARDHAAKDIFLWHHAQIMTAEVTRIVVDDLEIADVRTYMSDTCVAWRRSLANVKYAENQRYV